MMLAAHIMAAMTTHTPETAVVMATDAMRHRVGGEAGAIALGADGTIGWGHDSPDFPCAYITSDQPRAVALLNKEERPHE